MHFNEQTFRIFFPFCISNSIAPSGASARKKTTNNKHQSLRLKSQRKKKRQKESLETKITKKNRKPTSISFFPINMFCN